MLNMTYIKYIDSNLLCFIPGKVLDEMRNVLNLVESNQAPPRTHQLLQELRDLSSMAMEHFDEHILPKLKERLDRRSAISYSSLATSSKSPRIMYVQHSLSNELHKVKKQSKTHKHHISYLTQSTQKLCQKLRKQNTRLKAQSLKIREQERKIQEQNTKIQEQEATLADIKKHIDEWDQKYKDLTTELVRARDDILSATSQRLNSTNQLDLDRKRKSNLLPEIPLKRNRTPEEENGNDIHLNIPDLVDFKSDNEETDRHENLASRFSKSDIGSLISNSLENLLKNPLCTIKSRKRKLSDDIDLK
ncbi:hypothetical protein JTB14_023664 [Gonioctena quinquepunctata]|nr:hypothetical protein JTB14_023664 [Gonioctena quinquepunctata]